MKVINLKSETELSGFYIVFKGSTLIEQPHERGVSHLIEHLVCKSYEDLDSQFTKCGITSNAFTSTENIVYFITGLDEYVEKFKYIMLDRVLNKFDITEDIFEKERNIIKEEYFYAFSDGLGSHLSNMQRKYFNYFDAIGDIDAIENITFEQVQKLYKRQYAIPEMIINISKNYGNFDQSKIEHLLNKESSLILTDPVFQLNENYKHQDYPKNKKSSNILNIGGQVNVSDNHYVSFINKMLCADLKKPLYKVIREDHGLCYYVAMNSIDFNKSSYPIFYSECTNKNINKINELFIEILSNPEKYLNEEIFDDVLLYYMVKSKIKNINLYNNVEHLINQNIFSEGKLGNLTYSNVMEFYNQYYKNAADKFILTTNK